MPSRFNRQGLAVKVLVAVFFAIALLLPGTGAAGVSVLALVGFAGAYFPLGSIRRWSEHCSRHVLGWRADALLGVVLAAAGIVQMASPWKYGGWNRYDWGPHHALLARLAEGLRQGQIPHWVQSVSTGDSPYELYALLPYYIAAKFSLLLGVEDLSLVLIRSAIAIHILGAITAGWLARRLVPWGWALGLGLAMLYESGSVWGGGPEGIFNMGVVHSTLANALWPLALMAVLRALRDPSATSAVAVWASVAFIAACHPLGLVSALATVVGLGLVALLAKDVAVHRVLAVAFHVCLGVALVSFVWMPFGARLMQYGVQYPYGGRVSWELFSQILKSPIPEGGAAPIVYAGYFGLIAGMVSRRAAPVLLASFSGVLMVGLFDQLYVFLDLLPSLTGSRLQTVRLASVARVGVFVMAADFLHRAFSHSALSQPLFSCQLSARRAPFYAGIQRALIALMLAGTIRVALPYYERHGAQLRHSTHASIPDTAGFEKLIEWARVQNAQATAGTWGRLLHDDPRNSFAVYHLNARSGLPSLRVGYIPMLFLRDRIEDTLAASLRRFNIRWVVKHGGPPQLGDPATQRRFGQYFLREISLWDGQFARVERGQGRVVTRVLENDRVEVHLLDTQQPALVALGMGYYPRWHAVHETRGRLPLYAQPSISGGKLHVPSAWLPPGRTVFRADGPLPSDGKGRGLSILACLAMLGVVGLGRYRPARYRMARLWARTRRMLRQQRPRLRWATIGAGLMGVLSWGLISLASPAKALQLGNELWSSARVEWRASGGRWRSCHYSPLHGAFRCPGTVLVQDSVGNLLNNAAPSHAFASPVIRIATTHRGGEVRIVHQVELAGEYWGATNGARAQLQVPGHEQISLDSKQRTLQFRAGQGSREVQLQAAVGARSQLAITLVRKDSLEPARRYPRAPHNSPF